MSNNNVGKNLREQLNSKFENDQPQEINPFSKEPTGDILPGFGSDFNKNVATEQAGRAFGNQGIADSPFSNDYFNSKLLGFDLGSVTDGQEKESKRYFDVRNNNIDFEAFKADQQNGFTKAGALGAQFIGKTVVGVAGNTIGGIYGIGEWALSEKGSVNSIFDNTFYRAMDDLSEQVELKNSVFVNQKDGFGMNFNTVKGVSDAFSFIAGMVGSELLMNTVGNMAGGAGSATLPLRLMRYAKQMGKFMKGFDKLSTLMEGGEDMVKMARQLGVSVDEMAKIKNRFDIAAAVTSGAGQFAKRALTVTGYEAGMEARGAKDELMQTLEGEMEYFLETADMTPEEKAEYREAKKEEIERQGNLAGMTTFALNTAMLNVSNAMQFPQIFGNSFIKGSKVGGIVRDGIGQVAKEKGKWAAAKQISMATGRILKNPATEFMEETMQGVASEASKNYFEIMMGTGSQAGVLAPRTRNIADSVYKAVADTYGTEEGLHEGLIGAVVGALGIPGAKHVSKKDSKDGKAGKKFQMQGGIWEGIRENRERKEQQQIAIDAINQTKMSDVLKYNKDNAIRASLDTQSEDFYNITGNKVGFESVRDNKVYRYTMDRLEKGMGETIQEDVDELKSIANTDIEKYRNMFGKDETFTKEEAIKEIENFEQKSKVYKDAYNKVNKHFNKNLMRDDDTSRLLIDTLTYAVATEKVENGRLDHLADQIVEKYEGAFTKEQIKSFVKNSRYFKDAVKDRDDYVAQKQTEKELKLFNGKTYEDTVEAVEKRRAELLENALPKDTVHQTLLSVLDHEHGKGTISDSARNKVLTALQAIAQKEDQSNIENLVKDLNEKYGINLPTENLIDVDTINNQADESLKRIADKKKANEFDKKKSSVYRKKQSEIDRINDEITGKMSKSMQKISKPRKVTTKELNEYREMRQKMYDAFKKQYESESLLDEKEDENWESFEAMENEFYEISQRLNSSMEVARYLYGFNQTPMKAYLAVKGGQFAEDLHNGERLRNLIQQMMNQGAPKDEILAQLSELEELKDYLQKDYETAMADYALRTGSLAKEDQEQFKGFIKDLDTFIKNVKKKFDIKDKEEQKSRTAVKNENAKAETQQAKDDAEHEKEKAEAPKTTPVTSTEDNSQENQEEEDQEELLKNWKNKYKGSQSDPDTDTGKAQKEPEDGNEPGTTASEVNGSIHNNTQKPKGKGSDLTRKKRSRDSMNNTLTISEKAEFMQSKEFRALIRENKFKNGMAATLTMWPEGQVSLETNNTGLEDYLKEQGVDVASYQRGYQKIKEMQKNKDFSELNKDVFKMDLDVRTFISWMPTQFQVFDELLKPGKEHEFDPGEKKPLFDQRAFFKADNLEENKKQRALKIQEYNELVKKYEQELKENLDSTDDPGEKSRYQAKYNRKLQEAQREYYNWGHNATTNFDFRLSVALHAFAKGSTGRLNLQIDHVYQGPLQRHTDTVGEVEEHSITELIDINEMDINDLAYGDRNNKYTRIDGTKIDSVDGSPFEKVQDKATALNGKVYLKYKSATGNIIPIQMNTKKFSQKDIDTILDHIEKYLAAGGDYTFKSSGVPIFDAVAKNRGWDKNPKQYMTLDNLMNFFMRRSKGGTYNALFLKNAYFTANTNNNLFVQLLPGDTADITIDSVEKLKESRGYIHEQLAKMRYTINKDFLIHYKDNDPSKPYLMKDIMKMYVEEGILNHSFTVDAADQFDKVFKNVDNKKIFISRAGRSPQRSTLDKPKSEVALFKGLKEAFVHGYAKKGNGEIKLYHVTNKVYDDVVNMYTRAKKAILKDESLQNMTKERENLTPTEQDQLFKYVVNEVLDKRIDDIMAIEAVKPGYLKNSDHAKEFIAKDNDSDLDKMYRLMEAIRATLLNGTYKIKGKVIEQADYQGTYTQLKEMFNKTPKPTTINSYASKEDRQMNMPSSVLSTEATFMTMMAHVDFMEQHLGEAKVRFRYDSPGFTNKKKKGQQNYAATGTVQNIRYEGGRPVFDKDSGKIIGGSVYIQIQTVDKDGKKDTNDYLLVPETGKPLGSKANIIKSISLPFADANFNMNTEVFDELSEKEDTRKQKRSQGVTSLSKNVESKINKGDSPVTRIFEGEIDDTALLYRGNKMGKSEFAATVPDNNKESDNDNDFLSATTSKPKADNSIKATAPTLKDISKYASKGYHGKMKILLKQFEMALDKTFNDKSINSLAQSMKKKFEISTSNELIDIYQYYVDNGIFEELYNDNDKIKKLKDTEQFDLFAQKILGEKVDHC